MKIRKVICGVTSTLFVASILTFGLSMEIASAHGDHNEPCTGPHKNDSGCDVGGGGEDPPPANPAFAIVGTSTIYLMDIDGSNFDSIFNRKTSRNMDAWAVRWSPDGNRIVYDRRYDGSLYTVDPDGSNVQQMDPLYNGSPVSVTPNIEWQYVDGLERIFFIGGDPNDGRTQLWDIYIIDPQGGSTPTAMRLTDGDPIDRLEGFSVSKDGTRMVVQRCPVDSCGVVSELILFQLSVDEGAIVATYVGVIEPNGITDMEDASPVAWSYDSNLMLIRYNRWGYLAVMEMDPSVWTVTPLMGGSEVFSPGCVSSATWSPDPNYAQIAFNVLCHSSKTREGVHIVDFNGGPGTGLAPYVDNLEQVTTGLGGIKLDWRPTWTASQ